MMAVMGFGGFSSIRPDKTSMMSVSGTIGMGYSKAIGTPVKEENADAGELNSLKNTITSQKQEISQLKEKAGLVDSLKAQAEVLTQ